VGEDKQQEVSRCTLYHIPDSDNLFQFYALGPFSLALELKKINSRAMTRKQALSPRPWPLFACPLTPENKFMSNDSF
jgi:hypothetical protein